MTTEEDEQMTPAALDRFLAKTVQSGDCWLWTGGLTETGYGVFWLDGRVRRAHRVAYEWYNGTIDATRQIDHLCRVRRCVNPEHLEQVDQRTNVLRGVSFSAAWARRTRCSAGHEFDGTSRGYRRCLTCHREKERARRTAQTDERDAG